MQTTVSVIVLSWNGLAYLGKCLTALSVQSYPTYDVLVVDNGSEDGSADFIESHFPSVRVIRNPKNLGVAAGWNIGLANVRAEILAFVNQDLIVEPNWLSQMISQFLTNPQIGVLGCKLLYPDKKTIQHAGGWVEYPRGLGQHYGRDEPDSGQFDEVREVEYVTGAAFGIRKECLGAIGTFDEGFFPAYYEDVDICLRARRRGYQVVYAPGAVAYHYESTSLGKGSERHYYHLHKNRLRFLFKYLDAQQLNSQFLPAEIENWTWPLGAEEATALRRVYAEWINPPEGSTASVELERRIQEQLWRASTEDNWQERIRKIAEDLDVWIPADSVLALIDDNHIANASGIVQDACWQEFIARRRVFSFLEVDGQYGGPPPDDEVAIRELERLRRSGTQFIVFTWPAFWWLDYYGGLQHHLRSNFRCFLENDRLIAFDLGL